MRGESCVRWLQQRMWWLDYRVLLQHLQICWGNNVAVVGITVSLHGKESVFLNNFDTQGGKAEYSWEFLPSYCMN